MKRLIPLLAAIVVATLGLAACNRNPTSSTAMNNSGTSAMPGSSTTPGSTTTPSGSPGATGATSTPTTTDTAANSTTANTAAGGPTGSASSNPAGGNGVSDTVTTGKIKAALAADSGLKDTDISVSTSGGVVTLSGTVKSQDQVSIATNLAQRQEGVQRVESQLKVQ